MTLTVACVLRAPARTGPGHYVDYTPAWVWTLRAGIARHLRTFQFRVLTDVDDFGEERIPLRSPWPGWWAKIELFRPGLFDGPVLYLDLDTVVVGDLEEIAAYRGPWAMLSDFKRPAHAQSGVMAWTPSLETAAVWAAFAAAPKRWMRTFTGDGQFLHAMVETPGRLQTLFPGQIVSARMARWGPPPNARLVCFHGSMKRATAQRMPWIRAAAPCMI